jgi:polysaccharide pyruvyl transferase WcaK-like protein
MENHQLKILVYGFYNNQNIGDDLFECAFKKIFPLYSFKFVTRFTKSDLENCDAVFFGGGSFVYSQIDKEVDCWEILKEKKIFYIGIGVESLIHDEHKHLMQSAKLIACRSIEEIDNLKALNKNSFFMNDIVFSLDCKVSEEKIKNSVLIIPNTSVVPNNSSPHWMHSAWGYFKSEFSQFIDEISQSKSIYFLPASISQKLNDVGAAHEIVNATSSRTGKVVDAKDFSEKEEIISFISKFETVITQRFHGIVFCEMTGTPYIAIHHHTKLKNSKPHSGISLDYYRLKKSDLHTALEDAQSIEFLSVDQQQYKNLRLKVENFLVK